ncbi:hypothetical protein GCM10027594_20960 [Hymenobacter agri]
MSLPLTTAPIYKSRFLKADRRTVIETAGVQVYRTSFEQQARFDDVFLRPGASWQPDTAGLAGHQLVILPIVGGALLTTMHETDQALLPGCLYTVPTAYTCTLTNPFEHETVNLLLLHVRVPAAEPAGVQELALPLTQKNVLVASEPPFASAQVGLYDSRVKDGISGISPDGFSLCYVINGSFEIEDRLAEHRDALLLWETPEIAFEALSETAILFYLRFERAAAEPA